MCIVSCFYFFIYFFSLSFRVCCRMLNYERNGFTDTLFDLLDIDQGNLQVCVCHISILDVCNFILYMIVMYRWGN